MFNQSFRAWLGERLRDTEFAREPIADADIDAVAKRLGVDPDLLLEVRAAVRIERHQQGRRGPRGGQNADVEARHRRLYQYHLYLPLPLALLWKEECTFRGVEGSVLLRSLIHAYLLSKTEPKDLRFGWHWKGKRYQAPANQRRAGLERAVVPQGAKRGLARRARKLGVGASTVIRGLVLEVLSGQHRQIPFVEAGMMFDDESRYEASPEGPLDGGGSPR